MCADGGSGQDGRRESTQNTHLCQGGFPGLKGATLPGLFVVVVVFNVSCPISQASPRRKGALLVNVLY